jgi:hypothetical protein
MRCLENDKIDLVKKHTENILNDHLISLDASLKEFANNLKSINKNDYSNSVFKTKINDDKLAVESKNKIYIYEIVKDYNPDFHEEIEDNITKSILNQSDKEILISYLDKQFENYAKLRNILLISLLDKSIPTSYVVKELNDLQSQGKIDKRLVKFINIAKANGKSLEETLDFIRSKFDSASSEFD